MIKCPYCKESFDIQDIIIGEAKKVIEAEYRETEGKLQFHDKQPNIAFPHYILSCPHCNTYLGCSIGEE